MPGFWKRSLVYFGVIDDVEEFDPRTPDPAALGARSRRRLRLARCR
jgi:hypothetical protein